MEEKRKPSALPEDGTIAVVAPSFAVDPERLALGERQLRERGFSLVRRDDLLDRCDYFAGDDLRRSGELMEAVLDPSVDGILCARGGYGCTRILPNLDPKAIREARKPLAGYSDITSLLLWQWRQARLVGFHAPMFDRGDGLTALELDQLVRMLTGTALEGVLRGVGASGGVATGPVRSRVRRLSPSGRREHGRRSATGSTPGRTGSRRASSGRRRCRALRTRSRS